MRVLLEMDIRKMMTLYDLDTLHEFSKSITFPFHCQFHRPASEPIENLVCNRNLRPPCAQHQEPNRLIQHLQCSDPWPNCSLKIINLNHFNFIAIHELLAENLVSLTGARLAKNKVIYRIKREKKIKEKKRQPKKAFNMKSHLNVQENSNEFGKPGRNR